MSTGDVTPDKDMDSVLDHLLEDDVSVETTRCQDMEADEGIVCIPSRTSESELMYFDDYYSQTSRRLKARDSTLQSLELHNPMLWDLDRWRRYCAPLDDTWSEEGDNERSAVFDAGAWLDAMAELLRLAHGSPDVVRLELSNIPLDHPTLLQAANELLTCDQRSWSHISVEECNGFEPRYFAHLFSNAYRIRSLHLINNGLPSGFWTPLGRMMSQSTQLRELRISERLDRRGMHDFAKALGESKALMRLELHSSVFEYDLRDRHCTAPSSTNILARGLTSNSSLRILSLSYCGLSDIQASILIKALETHPTLNWLDLSRNECGPRSCEALNKKLLHVNDVPEGGHLIGLTLTGCAISDADLKFLSMALPVSRLQHLHADENFFSDCGMSILARAISETPTMQTIWVSENEFSNQGAEALLLAVEKHQGLTQVVLDRHLSPHAAIQYNVLLNMAGRRILKADQHRNRISLSLWPLILERSQRIRHCCQQAGPADAMFYILLQEPALFNSHR